jgi:hypothetical protein
VLLCSHWSGPARFGLRVRLKHGRYLEVQYNYNFVLPSQEMSELILTSFYKQSPVISHLQEMNLNHLSQPVTLSSFSRRARLPPIRVGGGRVRGDQGREGAGPARGRQGLRGAGHPLQLQADGQHQGRGGRQAVGHRADRVPADHAEHRHEEE